MNKILEQKFLEQQKMKKDLIKNHPEHIMNLLVQKMMNNHKSSVMLPSQLPKKTVDVPYGPIRQVLPQHRPSEKEEMANRVKIAEQKRLML